LTAKRTPVTLKTQPRERKKTMAVRSTVEILSDMYSSDVKELIQELQFELDVAQREGLGENRKGSQEVLLAINIENKARRLVKAMTQYLTVVAHK